MKLCFIIVLVASLQVSAKGYSQGNDTYSLNFKNTKLHNALSKIERKLDYRILYSDDIVPVDRRVNLDVKEASLSDILNNLLMGTNLEYKKLENRLIIIGKEGSLFRVQHIEGMVTGPEGDPLPGVTVQVKGANTGTVTDAEGKYALDVPENGTLVFSSVGFKTQEIAVNGKSTINVKMGESSRELNELVVTGYTSQRKKNLTGSITPLKGSDLNVSPMGNIQKQLQGKVSGVHITASGEPGSDSKVRIRGFGSFTSNDPLYVVDGVPTTDISNIPSEDIENISILKDASSASIYGARAFAGVILITTKKGKYDQPMKVDLNISYGRQYPGKGFDLLNPKQTAEWTWNAIKNGGGTPSHPQYGSGAEPVLPDYIMAGNHSGLLNSDPATAALVDPSLYNIDPSKGAFYQIVKANKKGTNWYDEVTRNAPLQNYNLSLNGGGESSRYNIQLGYYNQQGVVKQTYLKRYTIRANTEFNIHDRVKIGENIQLSLRDNPQLSNGDVGGNEGNAIGWSYRENPLIPVHDIMGNFAGTRAAGFNNPQNPVANRYRARNDQSQTTNIFGNIYAEVALPYNIHFKSSFGGGYSNNYYNTYGYLQYENKENNPTQNYVYEGASYSYNWVWTNTLNFKHQFGAHNIQILLGEEALGGRNRNMDATGHNPFSADPNYTTISTTQSGGRIIEDGGGPVPTIFSLFAQVNYNYKDKYLFNGTIRRDGAAVFGPQKKYGVFPAFSLGWRLSQENFMKDVNWVNDLKLRGSYGEMGNSSSVPLVNQINSYAASAKAAGYDIQGTGNSIVEGIRATGFAAPATHWETNKTLDFGLDATLFHNLDFSVDWYRRKTVGLLYAPEVEATVGFLNNYPTINVGSMENVGVDARITKRGKFSSNWKYDITLNWSTYKNTILKISDNIDYFYGNSYGASRISGNPTINKVGHSMSSFYGYKVTGLWQSQEEIDAADAKAQSALGDKTATYQDGGERPGEFRFADMDGNGYINNDDRTIFGDPNPDFTYGIAGGLSYKNFELRFNFYGVWGAQILNYTKWYTDFYASFPGGAISTRVLDSWTPENKNTDIPIYEDRAAFSTNQEVNSYYMENGSYLRLQNLQLGYTFEDGVLSNVGIENLHVYIQGINLFTITKYDGLDPSVSGLDETFGVDYGTYPFVRQFIVGANITF